jgi:hypothetical protein
VDQVTDRLLASNLLIDFTTNNRQSSRDDLQREIIFQERLFLIGENRRRN